MENILLVIAIVNSFLLAVLFIWNFIDTTKKDIKKLSDLVTQFATIQKQNTTKLIDLMQHPFEPVISKEPNSVMEKEDNLLNLDENIPVIIPSDVKFEVEGGDTQIPPGFTNH